MIGDVMLVKFKLFLTSSSGPTYDVHIVLNIKIDS